MGKSCTIRGGGGEAGGGAAFVAPPPASTPPAGAVTSAAASWPHQLNYNGATVVVYQPQAIYRPDQTTLTARMALAITRKGTSKPIVGTVEFSASTVTDFNTRMVIVRDLKPLSIYFPSLDTAASSELEGKVREALAAMAPKSVPLKACGQTAARFRQAAQRQEFCRGSQECPRQAGETRNGADDFRQY